MKGTSLSETRVMDLMPPMITRPTSALSTMATATGGTWKFWVMLPTTAFACTMQPMPKPQSDASSANSMPAQRACKPRSSAYIAPPIMLPFSLLTRYLTPMMVSAYFVAIPNTPVSHIHSTEPGPPRAMAVPTPTMLPVPIVDDSAVVSAPNWDTSPSESSSRVTLILMALKMSFWMKPVRIVMKMWVPKSSTISGQPHRKLSSLAIISAMFHSSLVICLVYYHKIPFQASVNCYGNNTLINTSVFSSDASIDFAGLHGSLARKYVLWTVYAKAG